MELIKNNLSLFISGLSLATTFIIGCFTLLVYKKQVSIMEEQNKIALFDKRYTLYIQLKDFLEKTIVLKIIVDMNNEYGKDEGIDLKELFWHFLSQTFRPQKNYYDFQNEHQKLMVTKKRLYRLNDCLKNFKIYNDFYDKFNIAKKATGLINLATSFGPLSKAQIKEIEHETGSEIGMYCTHCNLLFKELDFLFLNKKYYENYISLERKFLILVANIKLMNDDDILASINEFICAAEKFKNNQLSEIENFLEISKKRKCKLKIKFSNKHTH